MVTMQRDGRERVVRAVCGHDCPDMCSLLVTVRDGRVAKVNGDPEQPFTAGFVCAKVGREHELVHSPDRLLTPRRRVGPKGTGRFEAVSWEEALDDIVGRWKDLIEDEGPQAIAGYCYSAHQGKVNRQLPNGLFHAMGATQVLTGTVCDSAAVAGWEAALGAVGGADPLDAARSDLLVAWGADLVTTNVHLWAHVQEARKSGLEVVVIDPQRNRTAEGADWHFSIPPGSDSALALSVMHVLSRDGLVDRDYVARRTLGFDRLEREVLPRFSPRDVAAATGIDETGIELLAAKYGRARVPFIRVGTGMSRNRNGADAVRSVALLPGVVGAYASQGGGALMWTGDYGLRTGELSQPGGPGQHRTVNQAQLGRALLESHSPRIRSLFVAGNNPAVTCADSGRVRAGLARTDLFTVVHDPFMSDTAKFADYVLPAATYLETDDVYSSYGAYYVQYGPKAVEPVGQAWPNARLASELAARMGLEHPVFRRTTREHLEDVVGRSTGLASGIGIDDLLTGRPIHTPRRSAEQHFGTPSGRLEFYSETMATMGFGPMPDWVPEPVGNIEGGPLRLLTAPGFFVSHTAFSGNAFLRGRQGPQTVCLAPVEAERRGLAAGDAVEAFNERGTVALVLEVEDRVGSGIALIVGQPPDGGAGGGTVNLLCSDELTGPGAGARYQDTRLDIRARRA